MNLNVVKKAVWTLALLVGATATHAQTYNWNGYVREGSFQHTLSLNVPATVSTVNILAANLENGCDSDQVYSYDANSLVGPALVVGETVQVVVRNFPSVSGLGQIINLGTDGNGNPTFTLNRLSCTVISYASGTANAGPGFNYFLYFNPNDGPTGVCDSNLSHVTAGFVDADGVFQNAPSATGTVTCSNTFNSVGGYGEITTGSFSGVDSTGQPFTVNFTISSKSSQGRYGSGYYATSVQWTITH
jgi:hypothetical protein